MNISWYVPCGTVIGAQRKELVGKVVLRAKGRIIWRIWMPAVEPAVPAGGGRGKVKVVLTI